jgi:hypothetical protein
MKDQPSDADEKLEPTTAGETTSLIQKQADCRKAIEELRGMLAGGPSLEDELMAWRAEEKRLEKW